MSSTGTVDQFAAKLSYIFTDPFSAFLKVNVSERFEQAASYLFGWHSLCINSIRIRSSLV